MGELRDDDGFVHTYELPGREAVASLTRESIEGKGAAFVTVIMYDIQVSLSSAVMSRSLIVSTT